ncbi:T9SS type A sorting domain-containing protein [Neolewinella aurantiaca]|uniref:T9SS type A sorting domain-containing protein n=1 Tax=Neolewinella aurantiaca TaxID=2602767 RepID=A0A5C7FQ96_9BACT|nr:T9SS type A sorting domain-containing protein [Neolewinella aurantiaca]TXF89962.1 T9SS type A sorting domain-containing protein [Neolewinella aurantiaca]
MKKLLLSLLAMMTCFTLSAQIELSGGCFSGTIVLTEDAAPINGKPAFAGSGTYDGYFYALIQIYWDPAPYNEWVVVGDGGAFLYVIAEDTTYPPSSSLAAWSHSGDCPSNAALTVGGASALPVNWLSFNGRAVEKKSVLLEWQTSSEDQNAGFSVQRLVGGNDWETIGYVETLGNGYSVNSYEFKDISPRSGENTYRLRQEDLTGYYSFSSIVNIGFYYLAEGLYAYPNPTVQSFTLQGPTEAGDVTLFSTAGQVLQQHLSYTPGSAISVTELPAGTYFVRFQNKETQLTTRISTTK